ncbi:helix-turn-helix domain-containing protein [Saccharothrix variisporea]|uniref:helix-turn-helix domain-containing protein n=1 Tax=Saccharothrix variisporea TaxID=543527 RepID=UPI000EAE69A9|nr:helix-turn-helix transcriptional regulator [Saccharothrix variisporea]
MTTNPQPKLWTFIETHLANRGLTPGDLVRRTGVARSCISGWRRGGSLNVPTARTLAKALDVTVLEVLVAADVLTEAEAHLRTRTPTPTTLTNREILAELSRRLR